MNNEERQELINIALEEGETLVFPTFAIKGFLGYSLTNLYQGMDSVYVKEKQEWRHQISALDFYLHAITEGNTFYVSDGVKKHNFTVRDNFPNILGWLVLMCDYTGVSNV